MIRDLEPVMAFLAVAAFCGCNDGTASGVADVEAGDDGATYPDAGAEPDAGGKEPGTEGGPCYGNGTCNDGLSCVADLCVKGGADDAGDAGADADRPKDAGTDGGPIWDAATDGGDDGGQPVTCEGDALNPEDFCSRVAPVHCSWVRRCSHYVNPPQDCLAFAKLECLALLDAIYRPLLDSGERAYHAGKLDACLSEYDSRCPLRLPDPCEDLFAGSCLAENAPCTPFRNYGWWDTDIIVLSADRFEDGCSEGLYCAAGSKSDKCGACKKLPGPGEPCGAYRECAKGASCVGDVLCMTNAKEGEKCTYQLLCEPGLACVKDATGDGTCVRMPTKGDECEGEYSYSCYAQDTRLVCSGGTCVKEPEEGDPCLGSQPACPSGLVCDKGKCVSPVLAGEDEPCGAFAVCESDDLVCAPVAGGIPVCKRVKEGYLGEDCNNYEEGCQEGLYCGYLGGYYFCMKEAAEGEVCYGAPPECDASCSAGQGCTSMPVDKPCAPRLNCPKPMEQPDPCGRFPCTPFGEQCYMGQCGPGMKCSYENLTQKCIPEHEHPEFVGPLEDCKQAPPPWLFRPTSKKGQQ
ncbi:MAG: hypothetical protein HY897_07685 [Deltaproteobacteria bacterium]|nr:hypothetical protein [Deltaproteobacteria bacterium]